MKATVPMKVRRSSRNFNPPNVVKAVHSCKVKTWHLPAVAYRAGASLSRTDLAMRIWRVKPDKPEASIAGDLFDHVSENGCLPEPEVVQMMLGPCWPVAQACKKKR